MTVKIQSVHFDADKKLLEFIQERINKITHYYEGIITSDVTLRIDKANTHDNKIAEIKLHVAGNDLFVKKQCQTFEEAVDTGLAALKIQVAKHKEKIKGV